MFHPNQLSAPSPNHSARTSPVFPERISTRPVLAPSLTLCHEVCHHLDYELFALEETFHTDGFYRRESSLANAMLAAEAALASG